MDMSKRKSNVKGKKLVYGVGINDADYATQIKKTIGYENGKQKQKLIWSCHFYEKWKSMLERCYSERFKIKFPTYKDCTVCEEWLTFSNFKSWMEEQDWQGKELDKDLLVVGNKIYSPQTCCFLTKMINTFIMDRENSK